MVYEGREENMNPYKARFAAKTERRTLAEALKDADVFAGLSAAKCVTPEMLRSMADHPIVFALANPVPEISYDEAKAARSDVIIATGRSDYPNQVNNVLGFPFIFRGALDVRARAINEAMKLAATRALAALAKEDVPDSVLRAYGVSRLQFGPEYIIPKPFDPRVLIWESAAVAEAAMQSGVAQITVDLDEYREQLQRRLGRTYAVMQNIQLSSQGGAQTHRLFRGRARKDHPRQRPPGGGKHCSPHSAGAAGRDRKQIPGVGPGQGESRDHRSGRLHAPLPLRG